jgi:hypothetical protein
MYSEGDDEIEFERRIRWMMHHTNLICLKKNSLWTIPNVPARHTFDTIMSYYDEATGLMAAELLF